MFLQIAFGAILLVSLFKTPNISVLVICKTTDKGSSISLMKEYCRSHFYAT